MSQEPCSVSDCSKPGTLHCTGCTPPPAHYCSKDCQKRDWKTHKLHCPGAQKYNCFLIRASAPSSATIPLLRFADHIEPFTLQAYGDEASEQAELKSRLGWKSAYEVGKFYDHTGADTWYYFIYGQTTTTSLPKNEIASLCAINQIHGDVAVLRSSPVGYNKYNELFSKTELVKTVEYYHNGAKPYQIFGEREKARALRKFGLSRDS